MEKTTLRQGRTKRIASAAAGYATVQHGSIEPIVVKVGASAKGLPPRQAEALNHILAYKAETGNAPTQREIGYRMGISQRGAWGHVQALRKKGLVVDNEKNCSRNCVLPDEIIFSPEENAIRLLKSLGYKVSR